jgi:predicted AAA+ superfamily ATPase
MVSNIKTERNSKRKKMTKNIEGKEKLKKLLYFHNPWWVDHKVPDSLKLTYQRPVLKKLLEYFKLDRAILIKGPRRTGKTTLLYQIIDELISKREISPQDIIYLSCDDPELKLLTSPSSDSRINLSDILDVYEQLRGKTIKELKPNEKIYLFLDEVHFWGGWQFYIIRFLSFSYQERV